MLKLSTKLALLLASSLAFQASHHALAMEPATAATVLMDHDANTPESLRELAAKEIARQLTTPNAGTWNEDQIPSLDLAIQMTQLSLRGLTRNKQILSPFRMRPLINRELLIKNLLKKTNAQRLSLTELADYYEKRLSPETLKRVQQHMGIIPTLALRYEDLVKQHGGFDTYSSLGPDLTNFKNNYLLSTSKKVQCLWNFSTTPPQPVTGFEKKHQNKITHLTSCQDNVFVATSSDDAKNLWYMTNDGPVCIANLMEHHNNPIALIGSNNSKKHLLTISNDAANLWDISTPTPTIIKNFNKDHTTPISKFYFSPDDVLLFTQSKDQRYFWNLSSGTPVIDQCFSQNNPPDIFQISFIPKTNGFITSGYYTYKLWSWSQDGIKLITDIQNHHAEPIRWIGNEKKTNAQEILYTQCEKTLNIWNFKEATLKHLATIPLDESIGRFIGASFNPKTNKVRLLSEKKGVQIWKLCEKELKKLYTIHEPNLDYYYADESRDGELLYLDATTLKESRTDSNQLWYIAGETPINLTSLLTKNNTEPEFQVVFNQHAQNFFICDSEKLSLYETSKDKLLFFYFPKEGECSWEFRNEGKYLCIQGNQNDCPFGGIWDLHPNFTLLQTALVKNLNRSITNNEIVTLPDKLIATFKQLPRDVQERLAPAIEPQQIRYLSYMHLCSTRICQSYGNHKKR